MRRISGFGASLVEPPRDVSAGAGVVAHAVHHAPPQRMVRLTVSAAVQSVTGDLARGTRCCVNRLSERSRPRRPSRARSAYVRTPALRSRRALSRSHETSDRLHGRRELPRSVTGTASPRSIIRASRNAASTSGRRVSPSGLASTLDPPRHLLSRSAAGSSDVNTSSGTLNAGHRFGLQSEWSPRTLSSCSDSALMRLALRASSGRRHG